MSARRLCLVVSVTVVAVFVFGVVSAFAVVTPPFSGLSFGPDGVGGGVFGSVQGVAVDDGTGNVYVLDSGVGGGSVYKFDAAGRPAAFSKLEEEHSVHPDVIEGVGGGGMAENQIAVDDSVAGVAKGDIYVANGESGQVRVYSATGTLLGKIDPSVAFPENGGEPCGVAVDGAGSAYVGYFSGHVDKYTPSDSDPSHDAFVGQLDGVGSICNIAADSVGSVYTSVWGGGANTPVTKYEASQFGLPIPASALFPEVGTAEGRTLALDLSSGDVYVDQGNEIVQYTSAGALLTSFGSGEPGALSESAGIAVNRSSGDPATREVYAANGTSGQVEIFGPPVVLPSVLTGKAMPAGAGETLNGTVNPNEVAVSSCEFEYGLIGQASTKVACAETPVPGGTPAEVHADLNSAQLIPLGEYRYKLIASNAQGIVTGTEQVFTAPGPPVVANESVINVSASSATLQAQVNPGHSQTTYHFEYDTTPYPDSTKHGTSLPIPDVALGAGGTAVTGSVHVQGLISGTVYHYRVVATNLLGTVLGVDATFTTQSLTVGSVLPDGRQYELVSFPDKYGTEAVGIAAIGAGGVVQAAADGSRITYLMFQPPVLNPPGNPPGSQIFSVRGSSDWHSQVIATPHNAPTGVVAGAGSEYRAFSDDLSIGLIEPLGTTPLAVEAPARSRTLYLRDDLSGGYRTLVNASELPEGSPSQPLQFVGGSPDLTHSLFESGLALTPGAIPAPNNLYEWADGQLRLVNLLPDGKQTAGFAGLGSSNSRNTRGAVSNDGSNTIWTDTSNHLKEALYDRDLNSGTTVQVDAAHGGPESGNGNFAIAEANASKVFFTDQGRLTADSSALGYEHGSSDLYEFNADTHQLVDLSVDTDSDDVRGANVLGVVGASEDGAYVYFVATGVLGSGAASNANNLYVEHDGDSGWEAPKFIATLGAEGQDWIDKDPPSQKTSRVSPNGRFVTFMSGASLTGYANRDAVSGAGDVEVFVYDAVTGRLSCASCDPSGARPIGELDEPSGDPSRPFSLSMDPTRAWEQVWVAGMIPSLTPFHLGYAEYQSRFLSDDGRVFFDSSDALVARDTNGMEDVYEFEPDGVGSCGIAKGCVSLISAGTGGSDSSFVDASVTSDDVFFITRDRLVGEDFDHVFDVYDAHVCSSGVPCFAMPPVLPSPCSTGDGCKPSASPQPSVFGNPSSATFSGIGNVRPASVKAKGVVKHPIKHKAKRKKKKLKKRNGRRVSRGKREVRGVGVSGRAKR